MAHHLPLRLSASAARSFQECPYRYARDYVDRLPKEERAAVPSLAFGSAVHQALAQFVRNGGAPAVSPDDLKALLLDAWHSEDYPDPDTEFDYFQQAQQLLESYHSAPYRHGGVQQVAIEEFISWRVPKRGLLAIGKIDRLCLLPDGTLEVVDYKTAARPQTEDDVHRDLQAAFYRTLVADAYRYLRPVDIRITFYFLAARAPITVTFEQEDFMDRWSRVEALAEGIRASQAQVTAGGNLQAAFPPSPGPRCRYCPIRLHCEGTGASERIAS